MVATGAANLRGGGTDVVGGELTSALGAWGLSGLTHRLATQGQPCCRASVRTMATLSRPIRPVRAISRTVSPARSRMRVCRNWNILILLHPTGLPSVSKSPEGSPGVRLRDARGAGSTGRITPTPPWPVYVEAV